MHCSKDKILEIVSSTFSEPIENLTDATGPTDISGWDSLGQLQLIEAIETEFEIKLSIDQVISINSIKDIDAVLNAAPSEAIKTIDDNPLSPPSPVVVETLESDRTSSAIMPKGHASFHSPSSIYYGPGSIEALYGLLEGNGIGIVTTPSTLAIAKQIQLKLRETSNLSYIYVKPSGEPKEDDIRNCATALSEKKVDAIIALGGGSTIDFTKLSWALFEHPHLTAKQLASIFQIPPLKNCRLIAIPTLFGSGSEASSSATFTKVDETKKSISVSHDYMPEIVILDETLPSRSHASLVVCGIFDALSHAIEGFVSPVQNTMAKSFAAPAIRLLINSLDTINSTREISIETLHHVAKATYWASLVQNHCSVGLTHSIAHQLSDILPHALGTSFFLVPVMESNMKQSDKYVDLALECGHHSADSFLSRIKELYSQSSIRPSADDIGQVKSRIQQVLPDIRQDITFRTNPVQHDDDQIRTILMEALS